MTYTETISDTADITDWQWRRKIAIERHYKTSEDAKACDADEFRRQALEIAMGRFTVVDEQYLDRADKTDPDNTKRVWIFGAAIE